MEFEAERLGGLKVDHEFESGGSHHRQVGRLLALEDAIDIAGRSSVLVDKISAIGEQAAAGDGTDRRAGNWCHAASVLIQVTMRDRKTVDRDHQSAVGPARAKAATPRSV
jgi:hypothetical protein